MKKLIMISPECPYIESLIKHINELNLSDLNFFVPTNKNLIIATKEYSDFFVKNKFSIGVVIWITGVAITNLLNKRIKEKETFTVSSIHYLDQILKNFKIDILVLGFEVLGPANLKIIMRYFLNKITFL